MSDSPTPAEYDQPQPVTGQEVRDYLRRHSDFFDHHPDLLKGLRNQPQALTGREVRDYLREHSDFFDHHPDLLVDLRIFHPTGEAVSLVEKQVSVLRDRNSDMRRRLSSLISNARHNEQLYHSTRSLLLTLLAASSREQMATAFATAMREDFQVEHASFILFGDPECATGLLRIDAPATAFAEIGALLKNRKPTCGLLRREQVAYLFPGAANIGSAAVLPLQDETELGVIALGSSDANYYSPDSGTLFLSFIAEALIILLGRPEQDAA